MVKGTTSMGRKNKVSHIRCRRCGRASYRIDRKYCAACGYGRMAKIRGYSWSSRNFLRMRKY